MDEQAGDGERETRKHRIVALLWGIAAALGLIALTLDTVQSGRVRATRAIMVGLFAVMAIVFYRRTRKSRTPKPPAS